MDKLDKLKKLADKQIVEKAKINGRIENLMEDLKENGFNSEKDAKVFLEKTSKKILKMKIDFEKNLKDFEEKYASEIQKAD